MFEIKFNQDGSLRGYSYKARRAVDVHVGMNDAALCIAHDCSGGSHGTARDETVSQGPESRAQGRVTQGPGPRTGSPTGVESRRVAGDRHTTI